MNNSSSIVSAILIFLFVFDCPLDAENVEENTREQFVHHFGQDQINQRILRWIGLSRESVKTKRSKNGLLLTFPNDAKGDLQSGVETKFFVEGDFEIIVRYGIEEVEQPEEGYGAGVVLRLLKSEGQPQRVNLSHLKHPSEGNIVVTNAWSSPKSKAATGRKIYTAEEEHGQLRITRVGSTLDFSVAEGDSQHFRKLREIEFGSEPVKSVDFLGTSGGSKNQIIVRLSQFSIRADNLPLGDVSMIPKRTNSWIIWVGLVVIVSIGVFYIRYNRRHM